MRDLASCSGRWHGFWLQRGYRGSMTVTLQFCRDLVSGSGSDFIGPFTIAGKFGAESADFSKMYTSHTVTYEGRWDGQVLFGKWAIHRIHESGEFELWPEDEQLALESLLNATNEERELQTSAT